MAAHPQVAFEPARRSEPARFYHPELDVLRFGAFFAVFLHHAFPDSMTSWIAFGAPRPIAALAAGLVQAGGLGVDLFFALSAYLITELLLRERESRGAVNVKAFYVRRILRIWPLYFFALLILQPALQWWRPAETFAPSDWTAFLLFAGNWACAAHGFGERSLSLLWSVSIEEQFYLSWPWAMRWGAAGVVRIAASLLMIATLARVVLLWLGVANPGIWCDTFARLDPIAAGAWFACIQHHRRQPLALGTRAALLAGGAATMALTGALLNHANWTVLPGYPLVAASAIAILAGALGPLPSPLRSAAFLGKISFGTYVLHRAVLTLFAVPFAPRAVLPGAAAKAFLLTILLALISYRYLESPFLRLKEKFTLVRSRPA
ncbi:MAG TPA: acyltransferase [Bryobacteraceae bacterium]|jgi:peptidoglycan/LPS O-acetylase OafA/YrhL